MATLADIQNKIYALTGTDATSYPNANMLIDLNLWFQKIVSMILDSEDETDYDDSNQTAYPIFKTALTANRDIQIASSVKALKIKTISVCYDGVNLYRASPFDINGSDLPVADAANTTANTKIDGNFARSSPRFDIKFGSVWLYPMPTAADVTAGGYMISEFFRQPVEFTLSDLTTGTLVPGFDASFHYMLAYGPAMEYCMPKQLPQLKGPQGIIATISDYEVRLRRQYSSKQVDRRYMLGSDYQSFK